MVWNGPYGAFENNLFANGSVKVLETLVQITKKGAITIVGGGDTLNLLNLVKGSKVKNLNRIN